MVVLLVQVVRGHALTLIRLCDRGNGLEAMRRIYAEFRSGLVEDAAGWSGGGTLCPFSIPITPLPWKPAAMKEDIKR